MTVIVALIYSACAPSEPDAAFDQPPESTYSATTVALQNGEAVIEVRAARVSAEFFTIVDRPPWLGRIFVDREFEAGADPVLVLSHRLWQDRLGAKPEVIGSTLQLHGRDHTVVGVMPPAIEWPPGIDLWLPRPAG